MSKAVGLMPREELIAHILASPIKKKAGINLALAITSIALHGQTTWDGEDYDSHYIRVAFNSGTQSPDKMIIGILHDLIEDTEDLPEDRRWSLSDLRRVKFSKRIINGVDSVTKREDEKYFDFIERCSRMDSDYDSIDTKLSDLRDNMSISRNDGFPNAHQARKQMVYIVSYQYLVAIKKGQIEAGSSVKDFMLSRPNFQNHMDLYAEFSAPPKAQAPQPAVESALEVPPEPQ